MQKLLDNKPQFNITSIVPSQLFRDDQLSLAIPDASAVESIISSAPSAIGGAASRIQAVQSTVVSDLQTAASEAASAAGSKLESVVPGNLSVGLTKVCFGWRNGTLECYGQPMDVSSVLTGSVFDIVVHIFEQTVTGPLLRTVRNFLIIGVVLFPVFSALLLLLRISSDSWRRACVVLSGLLCLLVPFSISTSIILHMQAVIGKEVRSSSIVTVRQGDGGSMSLTGLIFAGVALAAAVGLAMRTTRSPAYTR